MSKTNENKLVPKLRFPEFKNKGEWEQRVLGEVSDVRDGTHDSPKFVSEGRPLLTSKNLLPNGYIDFNNVSLIAEHDYVQINKRSKVNIGDILFGMIGTIGNPVLVNRDGFAIKNVALIKEKTDLLNVYLIHFLNSDFINSKFNLLMKGNAQKFIALGVIRNISLYIPNLIEQQKIASCLSSLDEVITAESQKLDILKDHKKGLLQNLLPQDGETVPEFRFKEFEDCGEWVEKELSEFGYLINGLTYSPNDVRGKGLLVLRSSNIQNRKIDLKDCVFVDPDVKGANLIKPDDILVCVRNGSKALIGKNAIIPDNIPFATHGAFMTVFRAKYPKFVFQLFQTDGYNNQVKADLGATINSINGKNFVKYKFLVPKHKEQKKIADTLSSIDNLINAQSQKIEALKLHKKGLLQGLFPDVNEVNE